MRSRLSATSLAWFSISTMAIGSIGGIKSGLCGYALLGDLDIPEVTEVAMVEEPLLDMLIRLERRLLTLEAGKEN